MLVAMATLTLGSDEATVGEMWWAGGELWGSVPLATVSNFAVCPIHERYNDS